MLELFTNISNNNLVDLVKSLSIIPNETQLPPFINLIAGDLVSSCTRDLSIESPRCELPRAFESAYVWAFVWGAGLEAESAGQEHWWVHESRGMAPEDNPERFLSIAKHHSHRSRRNDRRNLCSC